MPRMQLNSLNMISILGIFSCLKLQTGPGARASSWRLACDYNRGPKLVHYGYTVLFIYFTSYKLVSPNIVLLGCRAPSPVSCTCCHYHAIAWRLLRCLTRGQILSLSVATSVNIAITHVLTSVAISSELQPHMQLLFRFIIFSEGILL